MISAYQSALSALQAFGTGINSDANNIANSLTDGYKRTRVIFSETKPEGVSAQVQKDNSHGPSVYEKTDKGSELVEQSNVDMVNELTDMSVTSKYYDANLKSIKTQDQMFGSLLNIKA
jgi:flagellar basal-body rod protein FlgC